MNKYESLMSEVISLAEKGRGFTSPNPLVGSIIYDEENDSIEGRGFHVFSGGPHAEVNAIQDAILRQGSVEGKTLITNLEPCCHRNKKTPPCTELILKHGLRKVIIGCVDPNNSVAGKGVKFLRENGVEVVSGILADESKALNEVYYHTQKNKRPFLSIKIGTSLDGKISLLGGESKYITSDESRDVVHDLRFFHDAILVGLGTVIKDDPILNIRRGSFKNFNKRLKTIVVGRLKGFDFKVYKLFNSQKNVIFLNVGDDVCEDSFPFIVRNCRENLSLAINNLINDDIYSVLVEPGAKILRELLKIGYCDKLYIHQSTSVIGKGLSFSDGIEISSLADRIKINSSSVKKVGVDIHIEGYL